MRILHKTIFFLVFFFLLSTNVSADTFYPSGDAKNCQMIGVAGIGYTKNIENPVSYNESNLVGEKTSWITSHSFTDVATYSYPDAHRLNNKADFVAVPPNTDVSFAAWFYNYSIHDIKVFHINLFTSRSNYENGDLTKLGATGTSQRISFLFNGVISERVSKALQVYIGKSYAPEEDNLGDVIYTFKTIQPLVVTDFSNSYTFEGTELVVNYKLKVKNTSNYNLCNIVITNTLPSGREYLANYCIYSWEEKIIEFEDNLGSIYPEEIVNNGVLITDNNSHTESINTTQNSILDRTFEALPFVFGRNDSTNTSWLGYQPAWGEMGRSISVKLLPYSIKTPILKLNLVDDIESNVIFKDADEESTDILHTDYPESLESKINVQNNGGYEENIKIEYVYDKTYFANLESGTKTIPQLLHSEGFEDTQIFKVKDNLQSGTFSTQITVNVYVNDIKIFTKTQDVEINSNTQLTLSSNILNTDGTTVEEKSIDGVGSIEDRTVGFSASVKNDGNGNEFDSIFTYEIGEIINKGQISNISNEGIINLEEQRIVWNIPEFCAYTERIFSFEFVYFENDIFEGTLDTSANFSTTKETITKTNTISVVLPKEITETITEEIEVSSTVIEPPKSILNSDNNVIPVKNIVNAKDTKKNIDKKVANSQVAGVSQTLENKKTDEESLKDIGNCENKCEKCIDWFWLVILLGLISTILLFLWLKKGRYSSISDG